jgi:predicted PurR-regulated permease PerM
MDKTYKFEISHRTIIFTILFLLLLKFLWIIRDLIFSLFIAFIIVSALKPPVEALERKKVPKVVAALLVYLIFLFFIFNIFVLIVPPLIGELTHLLKNLPAIAETALPVLPPFFTLDWLTQYLPNLTNQLVGLVRGVFSNALFVVSTLFFGFYLLAGEDIIKKTVENFFEEGQARQIVVIFERAQKRMKDWFWGEVILMSVVGLLTFIGLNLIGMKYVLALAVLAGLLEVVPNLGPVIATVPAFLIGVSQSHFLGFATIALYFVVQQLENHLIVPLVMKKVVGLSPIVTLVALIVGGKLAGIMGVLLAVPTTLFLEAVLIEVIKAKKNQ